VLGTFLALALLNLDPQVDRVVLWIFQITVMTVIFWGFLRASDILADHLHEHAKDKSLGITPFIPLIKKTLRVFFVIIGVILIIQNMGYSVGSLLAGLGIGGLAVALAAQESLSNFFGSLVVAVDRPFKLGDFIQMGSVMGTVEEIGLRSSRLRTPQRTLVTIPNRMMASEVITNFSVMPQRRVDLTIGLTYDTTPEQMEAIVEDFRTILKNEPGVHQDFLAVNFLTYGAFSLDIQIIYFAADPNIAKSFELRERINLKFMRAVQARGLSFAFPTQTLHFDGAVAKRLAERKA
jgi:MscS family membrane protein